jgi:hypothetical protein
LWVLPNGNTFIGECNSGFLLEVASNGQIVKKIKFLSDSVDGGHAYVRNARKLENGNYLVAHYGLDKFANTIRLVIFSAKFLLQADLQATLCCKTTPQPNNSGQ